MINANCDKALSRKGYQPAVACQYLIDGNYSLAVDICRRYIKLEPECLSARLILARSYYHAGDYNQAKEELEKIMRFDPENLTGLKYLGDIMHQEGQESLAMSCYRRIIEIDEKSQGLF